MATDITTFPPSGGIRGTASEIVEIGGNEKCIAHGLLMVGGQATDKITVAVPTQLTAKELKIVAQRLIAFADAFVSA